MQSITQAELSGEELRMKFVAGFLMSDYCALLRDVHLLERWKRNSIKVNLVLHVIAWKTSNPSPRYAATACFTHRWAHELVLWRQSHLMANSCTFRSWFHLHSESANEMWWCRLCVSRLKFHLVTNHSLSPAGWNEREESVRLLKQLTLVYSC